MRNHKCHRSQMHWLVWLDMYPVPCQTGESVKLFPRQYLVLTREIFRYHKGTHDTLLNIQLSNSPLTLT